MGKNKLKDAPTNAYTIFVRDKEGKLGYIFLSKELGQQYVDEKGDRHKTDFKNLESEKDVVEWVMKQQGITFLSKYSKK
ncbi:MAG: hypothetical protein FVQ77_12355 [Cytophagales bacterium]|nr:hypothetical protein [Cytophagales bacterium]